jgi:hypothetical protein
MASTRRSGRGSSEITAPLVSIYNYERYRPRATGAPRPSNVASCFQVNSAVATANGLDWCQKVKMCTHCGNWKSERELEPRLKGKCQETSGRQYNCETFWKQVAQCVSNLPSPAAPLPAAPMPPPPPTPTTTVAPPVASPTSNKRALSNNELRQTIDGHVRTLKNHNDSVIPLLEIRVDVLRRDMAKFKEATLLKEAQYEAEAAARAEQFNIMKLEATEKTKAAPRILATSTSTTRLVRATSGGYTR